MFKIVKTYFNWLQKDNPTGDVVLYPELSADGETSLKGVYIAGDLTGIPLLKLAANGASDIVKKFTFEQWKESQKVIHGAKKGNPEDAKQNKYDIVIIGGGPAGIAAALEAQRRKYSYIVLEATDRAFNTIENFPKEKPMFYEPKDQEETSDVTMVGATKEKLLAHFAKLVKKHNPNIAYGEKVELIEVNKDGTHKITTAKNSYTAQRTILASGKSGHSRKLGVPGENLPHVSNTLYDPTEFAGKNVLVVGGGDSAIESAMLLRKAGANVTMSYRKKEFSRPKPDNIAGITRLSEAGEIELLFESNVKDIRANEVDIALKDKVVTKTFDNVFTLIGTQLPYEFFDKCGIKIENSKTTMTYWWMAFSIAFMNIVYFGKASNGIGGFMGAEISGIFMGTWEEIVFKTLAWISVPALVVSGVVVLFDLFKNWKKYFRKQWDYIRSGFFVVALVLFLFAFFGNKYFDFSLGGRDPYYWYAFIYTAAVGLFGIRRIVVTKKSYVTKQTILLFLIQAFPLFIIPNYVLPWMDSAGLISAWVRETIFLGGEWWRFVGFILAWPLFIWNVFTNEPSTFWLITSLIQTFVIIPFLVIKYGKGAYCGWICSCGAVAETMGDEYRTLAPHGAKAKKWDNVGQVILFSILVITTLHILGWVPSLAGALDGLNAALLGGYRIIVDTFLAGVIGFGLYFFFGGRVWCRFFCPLAALMHMYNKFSTWRILADKKKCISCGLCTKSCHMGIDVMGYAQQGKPLDDVECVNCSACVNVCPTGVLSFGRYKRAWNGKGK